MVGSVEQRHEVRDRAPEQWTRMLRKGEKVVGPYGLGAWFVDRNSSFKLKNACMKIH